MRTLGEEAVTMAKPRVELCGVDELLFADRKVIPGPNGPNSLIRGAIADLLPGPDVPQSFPIIRGFLLDRREAG